VSNAAHDSANNAVRNAATAAHLFFENEQQLGEIHAITCEPRLSILGAVALWLGWTRDLSLHTEEPLVVRPAERYDGDI
jgi:hypothetical protein